MAKLKKARVLIDIEVNEKTINAGDVIEGTAESISALEKESKVDSHKTAVEYALDNSAKITTIDPETDIIVPDDLPPADDDEGEQVEESVGAKS